jgi:N-acetylglucosaminyldiphosphoundecaprenol N-acetyl-beta-D-mannosaminyltransferase
MQIAVINVNLLSRFNRKNLGVAMQSLVKRESYKVLGIDISSYTHDEFFHIIDNRLQDDDALGSPLFVVTVNPEIVIKSIKDPAFKDILRTSSINTCDGVGIRWAIRFLYGQKINRITGSDSLEKICRISAKHDQSVFFFGAMPKIARRTALNLKKTIPNLNVEGTFSPSRPNLMLEDLPVKVQQQLKNSSVIFVALGAPAQEKWIKKNLPKLPSCKLAIGVGGTFDFISGRLKRAPRWFRKNGLEWTYRLYLEPSRWRRIVKFPLFVINVLFLKLNAK